MAPLLFLIITFLVVAAAATHEVSPAEVHWNKALPNTPMPAAIRDLLHPVQKKTGDPKSGPYSPVLEEDMLSGTELTMDFARSLHGGFLPRESADSVPFSSAHLPSILARFPDTNPTYIKKTLGECEAPPAPGERKHCATSVESMVEYVTSVLDTSNVLTLSTVMSSEDVPRQKYRIMSSGVQKLDGDNFVACHARKYPYAVFYCHSTEGIRVYRVSAVGEDGTAVEAAAVCHNVIVGPDAYGTKLEARKSFCHLLPPDHVVWSSRN